MGRHDRPGPSRSRPEDKEESSDAEVDSDLDSDDDGFAWDFADDEQQSENEDGSSEGDEDDDDAEEEEVPKKKEKKEYAVLFPEENKLANVKNKQRRHELFMKMKAEKRKLKKEAREKRRKEAEALGDQAPPKQVPRTIENTREPDETMVDPADQEVKEDEACDEFASYFRGEREPKILVTTSDNPHTKTIKFCREFKQTIPNAEFRWRNRTSIKKMVKAAATRGYTDIAIINEDRRRPNGLTLVHLPDGPTAFFRLSSIRYCKDIRRRAKLNEKRPEVIMNNFNTRLGHSVGRMFASLFHFDPQFVGRRVVTFHNQRDYIFFRHHKYEFKSGKKVTLQEIGPRFTLKLRWLQKGTFDTKYGEYEWVLKRHEMETSRRRFFL